MYFLKNQKVATKILCVLGVLLLFILTVGGIGFYSAQKLTKLSKDMYEDRLQPIELMAEVRLTSKDTESKLLELIQLTDPNKQQALLKEIDENTKVINNLQEQYLATDLSPFEKQKFEELQKELPAYRQVRADIIKLATSGKQREAFDLYEASKPVFAKSLSIRAEISKYNQKTGKELNEQGAEMASAANKTILGVTLLAILLSGVLGLMLAKGISGPLNKMLTAVNQVADRDLREKQQTIFSQDEIGQLATAIIKMRKELRQLIIRISDSSGQVAASSEELTATAEQSAQAANQVAAAVTDISSGTDNQVRSVNSATSIIESMSASIEQIASSAGTVTETTDKTAKGATNGLDALNRVTKQISSIENTVTGSAKVVEKLGERSRDIGQIVETISGIAGQTNLLALNAAIEAARAGEAGRGFAVVAEEVRKLAEQSEAAAKQIADLIQETQQDTVEAVAAMKEGTKEVKVGTEVVRSAEQSFQEITASINQVSGQIKDISQAIQHMAVNSQEIVASVQAIEQVTKLTAAQTQTVSAATEEQSASMEEIASSSVSLAKLAEELQAAVQQFRT